MLKKIKKERRVIEQFPEWKKNNKEYLKELQIFLDKAENINDEELKKDIICQALKCDKLLTKIAQEKIESESIKKL